MIFYTFNYFGKATFIDFVGNPFKNIKFCNNVHLMRLTNFVGSECSEAKNIRTGREIYILADTNG